ncbi:MAG: CocE/NonD family hydrolase [Rhodosalinus sp.]
MRIVTEFPHKVREILHTTVPMPDGTRLAARIWMPEGAEEAPVPAILEYIPYRKNDHTVLRDATMQPYLAGHGYAVVRFDLRGAGDSEGLMEDEYLPQELQDGCDAIAWIADQPWCDGQVGMIGISWGGFNGLQIAALRPPALKAVVTLCSTDDRYADDIHYMGGCPLGEQLSWASVMFGRNTLPPDPANVGPAWRQMWMQRLQGSGLWLKTWLSHQRRDAFWRHGSICEDWAAVEVPVYAVSGWADGYCRSVFRLMENLTGPRKGLVGPWAHKYPHIGQPGPAIGFLREELRWWDHWLKGRDTGIMAEPMLRLYMQDSVPPAGHYTHRPGRWIAEPSWPSPNVTRTAFRLGADGRLAAGGELPAGTLSITSPLDVGMASGKWCGYAKPGDAPLDQRREDGGSLCFDTAPLAEALEFAGDPVMTLDLQVDRPVAQVAVRLVDLHPDGRGTRVSFGVLNLTHRDGHAAPQPLEPGRRYTVPVPMKHVAQRIPAGHRLRVAVSTSYFPMIWPAPEPVRLTLHTAGCALDLPLRPWSEADGRLPDFGPPEAAPPPETETRAPHDPCFEIAEDAVTGRWQMRLTDGIGTIRFADHDLTLHAEGAERYTIAPDDPLSATAEARWQHALSRGDWRISSTTWTRLTADATHFRIEAHVEVFEGDAPVHEEQWDERLPRDFC